VAGTCRYGEELSGSINAGNFLTSGKVCWLASQEGLCSMEYVSIYSIVYEGADKHKEETRLLGRDVLQSCAYVRKFQKHLSPYKFIYTSYGGGIFF